MYAYPKDKDKDNSLLKAKGGGMEWVEVDKEGKRGNTYNHVHIKIFLIKKSM